jgi:hypothetical protein
LTVETKKSSTKIFVDGEKNLEKKNSAAVFIAVFFSVTKFFWPSFKPYFDRPIYIGGHR